MKIIYNKVLPIGKKFHAINLFGVIFAKGECSRYMINHEEIHTLQMREMLYVFFYLWYVCEWLIRFLIERKAYNAYRKISFEREAYANQTDLGYRTKRRHFASIKYIRTFKCVSNSNKY